MENSRPILYGVADYASLFMKTTATRWQRGTVTLHRLVLVFHGGECVLNEEV